MPREAAAIKLTIDPKTPEAEHLRQTALAAFTSKDRTIRRAIADGEPIEWAARHQTILGLDDDTIGPVAAELRDDPTAFAPSEAQENLRQAEKIVRSLRRKRASSGQSHIQAALDFLTESMNLDQGEEAAVLAVVLRQGMIAAHAELSEAFDLSRMGDGLPAHAVAILARLPISRVARLLAPGGALCGSGLIAANGDTYSVSKRTLALAAAEAPRPEVMERIIFGPVPETDLEWQDFGHLHDQAMLARDLLADALARERPLSILLHGPPGTGKTAFATMLARHLDARPVFVGEADEDGDEPSRGERIAHFRMAGRMACRAGRVALVVDEAEDMLGESHSPFSLRRSSRVYTHRLIEESRSPVIWITNSTPEISEAVLRRMSLAIAFPRPSRPVRRRIVSRITQRSGHELGAQALDRLAAQEVSPGLLVAGIDAAARLGGGAPDADIAGRVIGGLSAAAGCPLPPAPQRDIAFDPALCRTDPPVEELVAQVAKCADPRLTFLFHGIPGTGKTALAAHLAESMGRDVMVRRGSDLRSKWVGETEKAIAAAFREAGEAGAVLVIDEADGFLGARAGAERRWEVAEVNEMLTWLEAPCAPAVLTTNRADALDPASLRRFTFKLKFEAMGPSQIASAFELFFDRGAPDWLCATDGLTPGDFAVAARRATAMGGGEGEELARMVLAELLAKPEHARARAGFATRLPA